MLLMEMILHDYSHVLGKATTFSMTYFISGGDQRSAKDKFCQGTPLNGPMGEVSVKWYSIYGLCENQLR